MIEKDIWFWTVFSTSNFTLKQIYIEECYIFFSFKKIKLSHSKRILYYIIFDILLVAIKNISIICYNMKNAKYLYLYTLNQIQNKMNQDNYVCSMLTANLMNDMITIWLWYAIRHVQVYANRASYKVILLTILGSPRSSSLGSCHE